MNFLAQNIKLYNCIITPALVILIKLVIAYLTQFISKKLN